MNPAPVPWILCGPGFNGSPFKVWLMTWRIRRFDGDRLEAGLARLDHLDTAADRSAGSDRRDDDVDLPVRIRPDLFRGGLAMNPWIGGVVELLRIQEFGVFF
jgi:hypothetical protein